MMYTEIKELLLREITENKFFDICHFIEEVYLMEYDVLILMARKFFNLFCVFHDINCQKYKQLKIPYENSGKIITNLAFPLIKNDLLNHRYKKVVVADDIIIHGRSIREVYDGLIALCPDLDARLVSYVRNGQETTAYMDIIDKVSSRYLLDIHEWRELSDEITKVFYMSGRPYISYLPYFSLKIKWENLKNKLQQEDCFSIQNFDMQKYEIEAFMYVGKVLETFQHLKCCQICAIRFYYYSKLNEVVAVPYFCMNVMDKYLIEDISKFIRNGCFRKEYLKLTERNNGADEMRIIELEYTFSAWMFMYFSNLMDIPIDLWHREIEEYTFVENFLPNNILQNQKIQKYLNEISKKSSQINIVKSLINRDIKILLEKSDELKELYEKNYDRWNKMKQWKEGMMTYSQRFIDNLLAINGKLDEERCLDQKIGKKRLFGIPISYLLKDIADYLYNLEGKQKEKNDYTKIVFAAILTSVDSGRGAIVNKVTINKDEYIEPVIYAGEQNYKFYDYTNFPIMYALYIIEQDSKQQRFPQHIKKLKEEMVNNFADYLEQNQIFYIKEEMLQISRWNISENYGKFLQNSYVTYYGNPILKKAVNMAIDICSTE